MSEILLVSLAPLGAIFGSAVSGFAAYKAATIGFKRQQNQKQLFIALQHLQYILNPWSQPLISDASA